MSQTATASETREWNRARRAAFTQDVLAALTQRPANLLPFEEVRDGLQLGNVHYLGLRDVTLDHIVGSVGRYQDFTRTFFPRRDHLKERWRRVDQLVTTGGGLPPIELYKVGQAYFVRDGNHRVSVARQHDAPTIEAHVWEIETHTSVEPDVTDVDDLLCRAARAAFLERTGLDRMCPDLSIHLTQPDGYQDLMCEIEGYQQVLSAIDEREVPFDEAVELWCEMRYSPVVEIIHQRYVLEEFPGRTETDLYIWMLRNQEELEARYQTHVLMEEAAEDLTRRFSEKTLPIRQVKKTARWMAEPVVRRADDWWRALRQALKSIQIARRSRMKRGEDRKDC